LFGVLTVNPFNLKALNIHVHVELIYGFLDNFTFLKRLQYVKAIRTLYQNRINIAQNAPTVLVLSKLKKINATAPQPQRNATF